MSKKIETSETEVETVIATETEVETVAEVKKEVEYQYGVNYNVEKCLLDTTINNSGVRVLKDNENPEVLKVLKNLVLSLDQVEELNLHSKQSGILYRIK